MKRVTLVVVTLALALALTFLLSGALTASPHNLSADNMITNLRMSATMGGPEKVNFLPGTQTVYASFDYANSGGTLIGTLTVEDDLATIFQNSRSYTGSGTQTFMIRGTDVFTAYLHDAQTDSIAMAGYINQAQGCTDTACVTQTVQLAIDEGKKMQLKLLRAQTFTNTPACLAAIVSATAAMTSTLSEGQTIMGLTSLSEMQAHLSLMRGHANNANSYVQQAVANINGSIQNAFPNTSPCGWRYNTSASADTGGLPSVADSVEWTVGSPGVPAQISLEAKPSSIPPSSTSAVKAMVKDNACIVVADGTSINFSASGGSISPGSTSTTNGMANAVFTAPAQVGRALITAVAGSMEMTTTVSYGLAQVLLSAFPMTISVNGGMSELSVELRDANGANIGYNVPVTLTTTLGKFLQSGNNVYNTTASYGHGNATLVAESQGGVAIITVNAGTALATTTIAIVGANTPTPTSPNTPTRTLTPTATSTRTPTSTATPTRTSTPISQMSFHIYLPVVMKWVPWCDPYEPNDDRYTNPWGPLQSAQIYQAKLCTGDAEDNYFFVGTPNPVQLRLQLPGSLVGNTSIWLYAPGDLENPGCGGWVNTSEYTTTCSIPEPGRYIIRLYTDGVSDNVNSYTLQATFQ